MEIEYRGGVIAAIDPMHAFASGVRAVFKVEFDLDVILEAFVLRTWFWRLGVNVGEAHRKQEPDSERGQRSAKAHETRGNEFVSCNDSRLFSLRPGSCLVKTHFSNTN